MDKRRAFNLPTSWWTKARWVHDTISAGDVPPETPFATLGLIASRGRVKGHPLYFCYSKEKSHDRKESVLNEDNMMIRSLLTPSPSILWTCSLECYPHDVYRAPPPPPPSDPLDTTALCRPLPRPCLHCVCYSVRYHLLTESPSLFSSCLFFPSFSPSPLSLSPSCTPLSLSLSPAVSSLSFLSIFFPLFLLFLSLSLIVFISL